MSAPSILAIIMAGGEGRRLYPLTAERSKPAVPFGGRYRIVDFVLSNMVNSGIHSMYLLVQYKSQSLIEHVRKAWGVSPMTPRHFVTVVPPQMREGPHWFQGTADAVYQSLNLIYIHRPDLVAVFGADHIYRMDVRQMVNFHREHRADITVSALPVPLAQASAFGIISTAPDGRITGFKEKPGHPPSIPGDPAHAYASMGNYLFDTQMLIDALREAHGRKGVDFGRDVLPTLIDDRRIYAYNFADNCVPGVKPYEEPAYWRDVGSIDAYYAAHQDLLGLAPAFDEFNTVWPIYSGAYMGPTSRIVGGEIENSTIGSGSVLNHGRVRNSVLRREVLVEPDVEIDDCIIMDYTIVGRGSRLRRCIIDRYNVIEPGTVIGHNPRQDRQRYHVSPGGVVVLPTGGRRGLELVY
ncbi:MAG: glucose-1-phosphate adenylyltransferase [Gammaproteobacteria bacterium]